MSDSTDDEAYDYDETGRESDDYSDDFGDETDDDAVDASPARTNSAEPEEASAFTHGASLAAGADVSQAASSAAAATTRFRAAASAAAAAPTPAEESTGASDSEAATVERARALRALNLMATGVVSTTDALLRGFASAEAFASRVRAIAGAQPPASRPSAETVERMIADLTPVCASVNAGFNAKTTNTRREDDIPSSADPRPSDAASATGIHTGGASAVSDPATGSATESGATASGAAPALPLAPPRRVADVATAARAAVLAEPDPPPDPSDKDAVLAHKLQNLRVNLLRIATRLGQSPRNTVVAQVIYRLELAEQLKSGAGVGSRGAGTGTTGTRGSSSSFDRAVALAESAERREGTTSDLGFTCTILLLGKSGVGKSSTINSLLGEGSAAADAFRTETKKARVVTHEMRGVTLRLIDTPGLQPSSADIQHNSKIMADAKRFTRKHKPDIVLYFDRMDQPARADAADLPLLKTVTGAFGPAIWLTPSWF